MMIICTALQRGGLALLCLLLALISKPTFAQSYCPDLPRQLDECTVCIILDDDDGWFLEFGQRAFIHNPVTFKFGDFPSDITISVDFADGNGAQNEPLYTTTVRFTYSRQYADPPAKRPNV